VSVLSIAYELPTALALSADIAKRATFTGLVAVALLLALIEYAG
jgi:hypothetical protein